MRLVKRLLRALPFSLALTVVQALSLVLSNQASQDLRIWLYNKKYRGQPISIGGMNYHLHIGDVVSRSVFTHGYFDSHILNYLKELSDKCNAFVDVGANIGVMSVNIAKSCDIPVLSLEPVSTNMALLKKNLSSNNVSATTMQVAIGSQEGTIPITLSKTNHGDHRIGALDSEEREVEEVKVKTLDNCIAEAGLKPPYLIKVDVQGYELHVLQGAEQTLREPCYMIMEIWPNGLEITQTSVAELQSAWQAHNLDLYLVDEDTGRLIKLESILDAVHALPDNYGAHLDVLLTNQPL